MRSIRHFSAGCAVAVVAACLAGQAMAASSMTYSLLLDGDNHRDAWKAGTREFYSGGSNASGQVFYKYDDLSFAVVLEAAGFHSQPGHPSDTFEIFGAANCVFTVELYRADGVTLETGATFLSSINDGTGTDPNRGAAFAVSYATKAGQKGRLIDPKALGGPRMEPIFTYPFRQNGKLIGMGAGFKEWNKTGGDSLVTFAGIGMNQMPNGAGGHIPGLGVVPIAEGQIDLDLLDAGTYILKVIPGNGNNVLRGDLNMVAATNRPAFAVGVNSPVGGQITFEVTDEEPCSGIVDRRVFYNNSYYDGYNAAITAADLNAVATNKEALKWGDGQSSSANVVTYSKGINGIMISGCQINRVLNPNNNEIVFTYGNTQIDPLEWTNTVTPLDMQIIPGATGNDPDRLMITFADNAFPNSKWLSVNLFISDPSIGLPLGEDYFMFGLAMGECTGNFLVDALDAGACKSNYNSTKNPAAVTNLYDFDRSQLINALDVGIVKSNYTSTKTQLLQYVY